jgi:capsular exopolysaccharide synthesis family protein
VNEVPGQSLGRLLWLHRWIALVVVLVTAGSAFAVTLLQTPEYEATATLVVNQPPDGPSESANSLEFAARTLAAVVTSENVAAEVVPRLSFPLSAPDAAERVEASALTETQLLRLTATDTNPGRAAELVNAWAEVFVVYTQQNLSDVAPSSLSVADPALVPESPVRPRPRLTILAGLVLGAALAVGAVLLWSRFDDSIHDAGQLERETGLPVLAHLPVLRQGSEGAFAESVRLLRTNVHFVAGRPLEVLAITSAAPGEGASTVAAGLARSIAAAALGSDDVLAVDGDLARRSLPERCGVTVAPEAPGLSAYIAGRAPLSECLLETDQPGLRLLPTGPPGDATGALTSARGRARLAGLRTAARLVVLDAPPVGAGADAAVLATTADAVVLVVDLARIDRATLRAALDALGLVHARVLGLVVNRSGGGGHLAPPEQPVPAAPDEPEPAGAFGSEAQRLDGLDELSPAGPQRENDTLRLAGEDDLRSSGLGYPAAGHGYGNGNGPGSGGNDAGGSGGGYSAPRLGRHSRER